MHRSNKNESREEENLVPNDKIVPRRKVLKPLVLFLFLILIVGITIEYTSLGIPVRNLEAEVHLDQNQSATFAQHSETAALPSSTEAAAQAIVNQTIRREVLRRCLNGVVMVVPGGRFGNRFMEMASAWAVARKHKLSLASTTKLRTVLEGAFSRAPLGRSLAEILSACPAPGGGAWNFTEEEALTPSIHLGEVPRAAAALRRKLSLMRKRPSMPPPGHLVIKKYIVFASYISAYVNQLRAQVEWHEELRAHAQTTLRAVAFDAARSLGEPPEAVVFVGVHVRRTDYIKYLRRIYHNRVRWASVDYYKRAVARLHGDLQDEAASGGRRADALALVLVSDDMRWARQELLPALNATAAELGRTAVIAAGDGGNTTGLQDLALLAACNHTVMGYGTYGMTAGLLAGGRVVAIRLSSDYPTSVFAKRLRRWSVIT